MNQEQLKAIKERAAWWAIEHPESGEPENTAAWDLGRDVLVLLKEVERLTGERDDLDQEVTELREYIEGCKDTINRLRYRLEGESD